MTDLKYTIIKDEVQYYSYCNTLETLVSQDTSNNKEDEIELLSLLIQTWDDNQQEKLNLDPVEFLRELKDSHNLSQNDLGRIAGVGKSYISEIFNYKKRMSKDMIRKFASHFKVQQEALNKDYELITEIKSTH